MHVPESCVLGVEIAYRRVTAGRRSIGFSYDDDASDEQPGDQLAA
jgi:hypothetical protein